MRDWNSLQRSQLNCCLEEIDLMQGQWIEDGKAMILVYIGQLWKHVDDGDLDGVSAFTCLLAAWL